MREDRISRALDFNPEVTGEILMGFGLESGVFRPRFTLVYSENGASSLTGAGSSTFLLRADFVLKTSFRSGADVPGPGNQEMIYKIDLDTYNLKHMFLINVVSSQKFWSKTITPLSLRGGNFHFNSNFPFF